ncbi:MAG: PASTA domain-containing protein [Clostridia bacterium]|nr:PASTA domain-containing protein [Clostridia bacterium]
MAKLCMGCMNPLPQADAVCTVCGYDPTNDRNPDHCLPAASALQGHYIVGRCVGEGSDHLMYLGYDRQLREPCFIQEFYPGTIGRRDTIGGVQPMGGCERIFEEYADRFRRNMRILARMRELPAVVPVYDIFEENGTVYAASDYCQGMTLTKKIKLAGGRIPWQEARPMFMSLLATLTHLNDAGICHLAICPDNILIGSDGKARLRSFSIAAARQAGTDLSPELKSGYAAPEQYYADEEVGAPADVYGVAATIFRTVTGNEPPAGDNRAKNSDDLFMPAEVAEELTQPVCVALFNALQVLPENRTATIAELRDQLSVTPTVSALVDEVEEDIQRDGKPERKEKKVKKEPEKKEKTADSRKKQRAIILTVVCCVVAALLIAGAIFLATMWQSLWGTPDDPDDTSTALPTISTTSKTTAKDDKLVVVDNVLGLNYYALRDGKLNGDLTVVLDYMRFSDKPAGTILSQEPAASAEVEKGTEIRVVISNGMKDEKIAVPDVSGWTEQHARLYLEALGFQVKTVEVQISNFEKGIVDGTDPAAGTEKRLGDTITLRVSAVEPTTTTTEAPTTTTTEAPTTTTTEADNTTSGTVEDDPATSGNLEDDGNTTENTTTTRKGLFFW